MLQDKRKVKQTLNSAQKQNMIWTKIINYSVGIKDHDSGASLRGQVADLIDNNSQIN